MKKIISLSFLLTYYFISSAQNVGVGTMSPTYGKMEIISTGNTLVTRNAASGIGMSFYNIAPSFPTLGFNSMSNSGYSYLGAGYGSFFQYNTVDGRLNYYSSTASGLVNAAMGVLTSSLLTIYPNGNIGIGTNPEYKFDVNGRMRIRYNSTTAGIWYNQSDNTEASFIGHYNNTVFGLWDAINTAWRFSYDLTNTRMGIGTMAPAEGLHIVNRNIRVDDGSANESIRISPNGYSSAGSISLYYDDGTENISIRASDAANQSGEIIFRKPGVAGTTLEIDGDYSGSGRSRIIVDEIQIKGGADFAEYFDVKVPSTLTIEPGMLVCIDEAEEGKMIISNKAYDKKVAGVISGANGIKAGMMMGHQGTVADGKLPVAISGRVYVKAETFNSPIKPGDLLTTSDKPGYAMKAGNMKKATGAIIGKAMGSLKAGSSGFVLVLLNIQ